jgi:cytoskeletal protein RodZ
MAIDCESCAYLAIRADVHRSSRLMSSLPSWSFAHAKLARAVRDGATPDQVAEVGASTSQPGSHSASPTLSAATCRPTTSSARSSPPSWREVAPMTSPHNARGPRGTTPTADGLAYLRKRLGGIASGTGT